MNKTILAGALAAATACSGMAHSASLEDRLEAMEKRLDYLEKRVQTQDQVILQKDRELAELKAGSGDSANSWFHRVEVGGVIEVEAGHHSPYQGDNSSDIAVATVELGIAAQINDWVAGEIGLLYEGDGSDLEVDVAAITIAPPDGPWFITAGQQYLPFGTYASNLVSDPLTLEIGETRETAAQVGLQSGGFAAAMYIFNGDSDSDDDAIDRFGAVVGFSEQNEGSGFAVNLGYISHIGDSDALQDATGGSVADYVAGVSVDGMVTGGPFTLIAEYTAAVDRFESTELAFRSGGAEPKAWNLEAAYAFALAGRDASFALAYQGSEEAIALELPETRIAAAISVEMMDAITLSFEWARDHDYGVNDGGTGNSADTVTAQLAVEF